MKPFDKSIVEVVKSQQSAILKLLLVMQAGLLVWLLFVAIGDGHYFPSHDDEVINYCSARLFKETGSVRAEGCIAEDVSKIGQMNWYGPGYHLVYGSLQRLFGDHQALFIRLHFIFSVLVVILIFTFRGPALHKLLLSTALVFSWQFTGYLFTYFPESLNLLMGTVLVLLILKVNRDEEKASRKYSVVLFILAVVVFSLCRITFIFWLAALIGLSASRREVKINILIFIVGVVSALFYMKYFTAPPYAGEMHKIDRLYQLDVLDFVLRTGWAALRNTWQLVISGSVPVYFLLILLCVSGFVWWKTRERLLLSAGLVSFFLIAALMAYYSADPWYFLKQSDTLVILLLASIMFSGIGNKMKYAVVMISLFTFFISFQKIRNTIEERRGSYRSLMQNQDFKASLQEIPAFMDEAEPVTVLWCYNEYAFGNVTEALLPFSTRSRQPILYTSNVVNPADEPGIKFKRYHKLKINYLLSRNPVEGNEFREVHVTPFYHLYKVTE